MSKRNETRIEILHSIIRENNYTNLGAIRVACRSKGVFVNRYKLSEYVPKLKKNDEANTRKEALLRRRLINLALSKLRVKERLLITELGSIHRTLNPRPNSHT